MHPIASLAGGGARLGGIVWGIEGDEIVFRELQTLVQQMKGIPIDLSQVDLDLYHLAAVFASNFILGVFDVSSKLWSKSGAPISAHEALIPLARSALANWDDLGLENALTGPIVRGDVAAVAAQLRTVSGEGPNMRRLYRSLALATAELASRQAASNAGELAEIVRSLAENEMLD